MPFVEQPIEFPDITFNEDGSVTFKVPDWKISWDEDGDMPLFDSDNREELLRLAMQLWMLKNGIPNWNALQNLPNALAEFEQFVATIKVWTP